MATNTTNYNLVKPDRTEFADISVLNENSDKIDTQLKVNADEIQSVGNRVTTLENATLSVATQAEAQIGADNTKFMTPKLVRDSIIANRSAQLSPNTNLDTIKNHGDYYGYLLSNAPSDNICALNVYVYNPDWIVQYFHEIPTGIYYSRNFVEGTNWTAWKKILNQDDYDALFQSVSNGKSQVAAAITGKGITTAADATFSTMASNIGAINTNTDVVIGTVTAIEGGTFRHFGGSTNLTYPYVQFSDLNAIPRLLRVRSVQGEVTYVTTFDLYMYQNGSNGFLLGSFGASTSLNHNISVAQGSAYLSAYNIIMPVAQAGNYTYEIHF